MCFINVSFQPLEIHTYWKICLFMVKTLFMIKTLKQNKTKRETVLKFKIIFGFSIVLGYFFTLRYFRILVNHFEHLLSKVEPVILKKKARMRKSFCCRKTDCDCPFFSHRRRTTITLSYSYCLAKSVSNIIS